MLHNSKHINMYMGVETLSAWAFFLHSMRICPNRNFLISFKAQAIPLTPLILLSSAKEERLLRGAEFSVKLSKIYRGQSSSESVFSLPLLATHHRALLGDVQSCSFMIPSYDQQGIQNNDDHVVQWSFSNQKTHVF